MDAVVLWLFGKCHCPRFGYNRADIAESGILDEFRDVDINERQRKVVNRLWDGFEGKLTSSKWAKICGCSQDTALRDINDLIAKGMLRNSGEGGRSANYLLPD